MFPYKNLNIYTEFWMFDANKCRQYLLLYRPGTKSSIFCFVLLLPQILVNLQNQQQIWNLLVLKFSKHPLHVQFDQVLAEIFEVKDTWYHSFIFMLIDLTERKTMQKWHGLMDDAHIRTVIMESNQSKNSQSSFNPSCNNAKLYIIISTQMRKMKSRIL